MTTNQKECSRCKIITDRFILLLMGSGIISALAWGFVAGASLLWWLNG